MLIGKKLKCIRFLTSEKPENKSAFLKISAESSEAGEQFVKVKQILTQTYQDTGTRACYGHCSSIFLAKFEQVCVCCNQLKGLNDIDLSRALRIWGKSVIRIASYMFRFQLLFEVLSINLKGFLYHVHIVFFNAVFKHVWLVVFQCGLWYVLLCGMQFYWQNYLYKLI